jgi:hypothetical protein
MATIATNSHGSFTNAPRRSYIAMNSYTSDLFGYSLTFNGTSNVGVLSNLGIAATSTLQGSILSETGKKLYPNVNVGVSTLMVSVYDQTSKVTGYINPNSPTFAIFNTDKPEYIGQGTDPGTDGRTNLGNSIYTHGSVIADGFGTYAGLLSTGTSLTVGTTMSVESSISSGTVVIAPSTFTQQMFIPSPADGRTAYTTATVGSTQASGNTVGGNTLTNISTTAVTAASKIFLSGSGSYSYGVSTVTANTGFVIKSSGTADGQLFNWWVIN